jgi:hypothetical protein
MKTMYWSHISRLQLIIENINDLIEKEVIKEIIALSHSSVHYNGSIYYSAILIYK